MESGRSDDGCAERIEAAVGRYAGRSSAGGGWVVVVRAETEFVTLFWVESVERVGRSAVVLSWLCLLMLGKSGFKGEGSREVASGTLG